MKKSRDLLAACLFLAPNLLGFLIFVAFPLIFSVTMAFTNWDLSLHNRFRPEEHITWVWLRNFSDLLAHPDFWKYFGNTLFMMMGIPLSVAGSLFLAVMLTQSLRAPTAGQRRALAGASIIAFAVPGIMLWMAGYGAFALVICLIGGAILATGFSTGSVIYRTLFYLPSFTSGVAIYLLWKQLYNPLRGPINLTVQPVLNAISGVLGIEPLQAPNWLSDVTWAKPAIMIMGLWASVGSNNMLLYIAGITNIPQELYEAADIDGASRWQRFWHVTWPQLAPTTFFILVMSVIGGLQGGFEEARTMTLGGPFGATTSLSYFVYNEGFETGRLGYASAVAWAMFVMIFVLTIFNYKFGSRYVNE